MFRKVSSLNSRCLCGIVRKTTRVIKNILDLLIDYTFNCTIYSLSPCRFEKCKQSQCLIWIKRRKKVSKQANRNTWRNYSSNICFYSSSSDCKSGSDDTLKMGQKFIVFPRFFLSFGEEISKVKLKGKLFARFVFGSRRSKINCAPGSKKRIKAKSLATKLFFFLRGVSTRWGNLLFIFLLLVAIGLSWVAQVALPTDINQFISHVCDLQTAAISRRQETPKRSGSADDDHTQEVRSGISSAATFASLCPHVRAVDDESDIPRGKYRWRATDPLRCRR